MKENIFRERVVKYIEYLKVFCYDESIRDIILIDRKKIEDKIEKIMDYRIVGGNDELLNLKIVENYRGYIEYNFFINIKDNLDIILEIIIKLIEYIFNKVKEIKYMNDFDEIYIDENGKKVINIVKYLGKYFFKILNMKVEVKYKLILILIGEVIL